MLLAYAPLEIRQKVLKASMASFNERTVTDPVKLENILGQIVKTGENESCGDLDSGGYSIAAAIRDANGETTAALSIAGYIADLDEVRRALHWKLVREGTREISEHLGWSVANREYASPKFNHSSSFMGLSPK